MILKEGKSINWQLILKQKPFENKRVYFANAISGGENLDPTFGWELVQCWKAGGAIVLDEHVAGRTKNERSRMFQENSIPVLKRLELLAADLPVQHCEYDLTQLQEATHLIAIVDVPSHGVGAEIMFAELKHRLGFNFTPILCLVHTDNLATRSSLIQGVNKRRHPEFYLRGYSNLEHAKRISLAFLTGEKIF